MKKERYKMPIAVILILIRNNEEKGCKEVLLTRRYNTGYSDGMYDLSASGHLEKEELLENAIIREAEEEIKVIIKKDDLMFSSVVHDISPDIAYINFNFICEKYNGTVQIGEPNKCDEVLWVDINNLPENIMPERKKAIDNYVESINFIENKIIKKVQRMQGKVINKKF